MTNCNAVVARVVVCLIFAACFDVEAQQAPQLPPGSQYPSPPPVPPAPAQNNPPADLVQLVQLQTAIINNLSARLQHIEARLDVLEEKEQLQARQQ